MALVYGNVDPPLAVRTVELGQRVVLGLAEFITPNFDVIIDECVSFVVMHKQMSNCQNYSKHLNST